MLRLFLAYREVPQLKIGVYFLAPQNAAFFGYSKMS